MKDILIVIFVQVINCMKYLNLGVKYTELKNTGGVARVVKHGENGFCCLLY